MQIIKPPSPPPPNHLTSIKKPNQNRVNNLKKILFTKKSSGRGLTISSLPILLSKIYTNNSSKELINDIEQLINNLYGNKQITKQVYNNLNKAIAYKNYS